MRRSEGSGGPARSYLSIREVLELLVAEYPDVTISKIRFLESRGLIRPERTPSGYRKFYEADVERLRWILRQQRENFLPLKVIKGRLEQANALGQAAPSEVIFADEAVVEEEPALVHVGALNGASEAVGQASFESSLPAEPLTGGFGSISVVQAPILIDQSALAIEVEPLTTHANGESTPSAPVNDVPSRFARPERARSSRQSALSEVVMSGPELAGASGASTALIAELESFGLIASHDVAGERCFGADALTIARVCAGFATFGLEPRHLRAFKIAAERDAGLYAQVITPALRQRNPESRERALGDLDELVALGAQLREAFLAQELDHLTGG